MFVKRVAGNHWPHALSTVHMLLVSKHFWLPQGSQHPHHLHSLQVIKLLKWTPPVISSDNKLSVIVHDPVLLYSTGFGRFWKWNVAYRWPIMLVLHYEPFQGLYNICLIWNIYFKYANATVLINRVVYLMWHQFLYDRYLLDRITMQMSVPHFGAFFLFSVFRPHARISVQFDWQLNTSFHPKDWRL